MLGKPPIPHLIINDPARMGYGIGTASVQLKGRGRYTQVRELVQVALSGACGEAVRPIGMDLLPRAGSQQRVVVPT